MTDLAHKDKKAWCVICYLADHYRAHIFKLINASTLAILGAASQLSIALGTQRIVDALAESYSMGDLTVGIAVFLAASLLSVLLISSSDYLFRNCGQIALVSVRRDVYETLTTLTTANLRETQTGQLMSHVVDDATDCVLLLTQLLKSAIVALVQFCGAVALLAVLYGNIAFLAIVPVLLHYVVPQLFARYLRQGGARLQEAKASLSARLQEHFSARQHLKAFGVQEYYASDIKQSLVSAAASQCRFDRVRLTSSASSGVLYWTMVGGLYYVGGQSVLTGSMSLGSLVALVWYFNFLESPIRRFVTLTPELQKAIAAGTRILAVIQTPTRRAVTACLPGPRSFLGDVVLDRVRFGYPGHSPILQDISFHIERGQQVALVGPSGSGKSTLLGLLARLYEPTGGRIVLGGRDIQELPDQYFGTCVSILLQEPFLFRGSVSDNIRFGRSGIDRRHIVDAGKQVGGHEFIQRLPNGYATALGERGTTVSGGERQRIGLARVLVNRPALLLLDEPMSGLDKDSQQTVLRSLVATRHSRTTLVATHTMETVAQSDLVVLLDGGRVVASGTYEDLRPFLKREIGLKQLFQAEGAEAQPRAGPQ